MVESHLQIIGGPQGNHSDPDPKMRRGPDLKNDFCRPCRLEIGLKIR